MENRYFWNSSFKTEVKDPSRHVEWVEIDSEGNIVNRKICTSEGWQKLSII